MARCDAGEMFSNSETDWPATLTMRRKRVGCTPFFLHELMKSEKISSDVVIFKSPQHNFICPSAIKSARGMPSIFRRHRPSGSAQRILHFLHPPREVSNGAKYRPRRPPMPPNRECEMQNLSQFRGRPASLPRPHPALRFGPMIYLEILP